MRESIQLFWELLWIPVTCGYGLFALALVVFGWLKGRRPDDESLERYDLNGLSGILLVLTINAMIWVIAYCAYDGVRLFGIKDNIHHIIAGSAFIAAFFLPVTDWGRTTRFISLLLVGTSFIPLIFLEGTAKHSYDCLVIPALIGFAAVQSWLWRKAAPQADVRQ